MNERWYDDHTKIAAFSIVLEDAGILDPEDTKTYRTFLTKPFMYDEIYQSWEELGFPSQGDDNWEEFTNLLVGEEEEESNEE
jgi:hypothetical protein